MDAICQLLLNALTVLAYFVAVYDTIKILRNSYKYGKLSGVRMFWVKMAIRLLPGYLREKIERFSDDDIDIQIKKLNGDRKVEQLNALEHLEQILKFIPTESANTQDFQKIKRIQRAIYKLLWHTKTDPGVVKKAVDMLCGNNHLRTECNCNVPG